MRRHIAGVIVAAVVAGTSVQTGAAAWFTYGCNSARTFQSDLPGPGETISLVMSGPTEMPVGSRLMISDEGSIYQFNRALRGTDDDGLQIFEDDMLYEAFIRGGLLVNSGILIWTGWWDSPELHTFDRLGHEIESAPILMPDGSSAPDPHGYPALATDGSIIVTGDDYDDPILMRFGQDGVVNWVNGQVNISPPVAVSADGRIVAVPGRGNSSPKVTCFSSKGDQLWSANFVGYPGPPMIDDARGRVLVRRLNSISAVTGLLCLDIESGEVLWEYVPEGYEVPAGDRFEYPLAMDSEKGIVYAMWLDDDRLPREYYMTAISDEGALLWSRTWLKWGTTCYQMATHPVIDRDGYLYLNGMRCGPGPTRNGTTVSIIEVLKSDGELVKTVEYPFDRASGYVGQQELARFYIGTFGRLYFVDGDMRDNGQKHLYAFGRPDDPLLNDYRPVIISAGFGTTDLASDGSRIEVTAEVWHPMGYESVDRVEARIKGENKWYSLNHTENGHYELEFIVADGGVNTGQHLVEIVAYDVTGRPSLAWPYLSIKEGSK